KILSASRNELYLSMRFLDLALSGLKYEMNLSSMYIGTDGEKILFNPRYLVQRYLSDRVLVNRAYLHMIVHCLFRHPFHLKGREEELWHLACDIAAESVVDSLPVKSVQLVVSDLRNETYDMLRRELKVLSAEGIYRVLQEKQLSVQEFGRLQLAFWVDDHVFWEHNKDDNEEENEDNQQEKNQDQEQQNEQNEDEKRLEQKWTEIGEKTETNLETFSKDMGEEAGTLLQYLKIENRERYDYRQFLQKFVTLKEDMRVDDDAFDFIFYTYGLQLYGNLPLIEALEYKEVKKVEELVIAIDTSESCEGETVKRFLEETYAILSSSESFFHKVNIHIIQCDAQVQLDKKITSAEELALFMEEFELRGSGGTDFRPVFQYVDRLIEEKAFQNLKGLLYFTDGYGTFPRRRPTYDTAFLFYHEDYMDVNVPPWAMKLILGKDDFSLGTPSQTLTGE
ncbi:MAG: VWA-like domain-containing protein, partial [Bacillota bacterium]|nr:VWA-like domain-containing protein [Bacillota bacterium]